MRALVALSTLRATQAKACEARMRSSISAESALSMRPRITAWEWMSGISEGTANTEATWTVIAIGDYLKADQTHADSKKPEGKETGQDEKPFVCVCVFLRHQSRLP